MKKSRLFLLPILTMSLGVLSSCVEDDLSSLAVDLQSQIDELKNEITSLKTQIADLKKEMADADQAIKSEYDGKISEINETIASLNAQLETLTTQYQQDKEAITNDYNTKINNLKEYTDGKILELNNKNTELNQQLTELSNKHDADKQALKEDYEAQLAALASSSQSERERLEQDYNSKLDALNQAFSEAQTNLQNQITANKTAMETFASNYLTEKAAMELDYNTKINNLKTTYETKVAEIESSIATCNSSIDALRAEMNAALLANQNDYNAKINALTDRVAVLEAETYHTVIFDTGLGSHVENQVIKHGEKVAKPVDPSRPGFTFEGWTYNGNPWVFYGYVVSEDMTLTANWEYIDYTVTFKNDDGTVLEIQTPVHYGDSVTYHGDIPVKPNPVDHYIYIFNGWDVDLTNIMGDTVAIAQYTAEYAPYTAYYLDENDNVICSVLVKEGETATYPGETPTKESDLENQLQYQFSGWDEVGRTEDTVTYKVHFESCTRGLVLTGNTAYQYTGNSENVIVPSRWNGNDITSIGEAAFSGNSYVTSVIIKNGIKIIENKAFANCSNLTAITLPDSLESIEQEAFETCRKLNSINLPDSIQNIGHSAFYNCEAIESICLPNNLTIINSEVFRNCTALKNITLPNSLATIDSYAFHNCGVQNITFPSSLTTINTNAFWRCKSLETIFLPDTIISLGDQVFRDCNCLILTKRISKPSGWELNWNSECEVVWGFERIVDNDGYSYALSNNDGAKTAYLINFDSSLTSFNPLEEIEGYKLIYANLSLLSGNSRIEKVTIPNCVRTIKEYTFENCVKLKTVKLHENIQSIGAFAFSGCTSLKNIAIPDSVTEIGEDAFYLCYSLQRVTLSNSIKEIKHDTFFNCTSLKYITVPKGVTAIGDDCWLGCTSLTTMVLPNSIETIGSNILRGCYSLENVYYVGTESEWGNVSIHSTNDFESKLLFVDESEIPPSASNWIDEVDNALSSYCTLDWDGEKEMYIFSQSRDLGAGETVKSVAEDIADELLNDTFLGLNLLVSNVSDAKEAKYILFCEEGSVDILYSQYYGDRPFLSITVRIFDTRVNSVINSLSAVLNVNLQVVQEVKYGADGQFAFPSKYSLQQYGSAILRGYIAADLIACTALGFTLKSCGMSGNNYVGEFQNADGYIVEITLLGDADKNYSNEYTVLVTLP